MATTVTDLETEIYLQHLEEASFLYGQRSRLDIGWRRLADFEERFEAHLDALVIGEEEALELCRIRSVEGDPGELHVAVCLFCRQQRRDLVAEVLEQLVPDDPERWRGVADALQHEIPADWHQDFVPLLETDDLQLSSLVAKVAGYRRINAGSYLMATSRRSRSSALLWAAGRVRERRTTSLLLGSLLDPDREVSSSAALSLLRLGERQAVSFCQEMVGQEGWVLLLVALGAGRSAGATLAEVAASAEASPDALLALGILGEISAVSLLISKLEGDLAASAALALNLLTGAGLYERVFIPEEVDEDELFPEELASYRKDGKVPTKADGSPYGEWVTRLSQKPEEWRQWWDENGHDFHPGVRYRNGRPCHPAELLATLQHENAPRRIRQLAYEELVIRYDADFPFEADLPVTDQLLVLETVAAWINDNGGRFLRGEWYFGGEIIPDSSSERAAPCRSDDFVVAG